MQGKEGWKELGNYLLNQMRNLAILSDLIKREYSLNSPLSTHVHQENLSFPHYPAKNRAILFEVNMIWLWKSLNSYDL